MVLAMVMVHRFVASYFIKDIVTTRILVTVMHKLLMCFTIKVVVEVKELNFIL